MSTALAPATEATPTVGPIPTGPIPAAPRVRRSRRSQPGRPRLIAVPDAEPPFDDERRSVDRIRRAVPRRPVALADPDVHAPATAFRAAGTAAAPLVAADVPDLSYAPDFGVEQTPSSQLPPAAKVAVTLGRALIETLTGVRPSAQLRTHCTPPVFAGLQRHIPLTGRGLARVQSVHTSEPSDGVAEVCLVLRRGDRCRAIAFRMTGLDGRWRITALQVG